MKDFLAIAAIAGACSGAIGLLGLVTVRLLRRSSLLHAFLVVAIVSVLAFVAGILGTASAMFLSPHDFQVTLMVSAVAGLVSIVIALLLARQVMRGSEALRAATRELGEAGSYTPPGRTPTAELAALSAELERASIRLAEARDRERALEASRRDLMAWVSHDLRTPLAGLRAMAEALEDGVVDVPKRYHAQIRIEVERLTKMVDDLFALARIHAGALQLSLARVSVSDLVSDALAGADPLARARGVGLSGRASAASATVVADAAELSRVLTNLVANAIRHTPSDGAVVISAGAYDGQAVVSVEDGCGGIPEADLPRVFEVAWRGTAARTPEGQTGAGLGLAIVRGIVEAHQGSVSVRNVGPGCRFEVRLPLSLPVRPARHAG